MTVVPLLCVNIACIYSLYFLPHHL